ncbi:30S ribosome-binding factor RbfA [Chitinophaga sp.]|uniref:30S ribosome-binding factor RbfA n=1 Tax=Chitinophaga sp. TaxID=1869181 RepID=UPI0031D0767E
MRVSVSLPESIETGLQVTTILIVMFPHCSIDLNINNSYNMQESKRQKQIGQLLQKELSDIFQRIGFNVIEGGMISISAVRVTPDLLEARVYLSMFQIKDNHEMINRIKEQMGVIKRELGNRVGKQLRRIPEITLFLDDTLDYVFKMEELFKKINDDDAGRENK